MLYQYWDINLTNHKRLSLSKKIDHIIIAGHLAPSSHNTQPWLFKKAGLSIELHGDPAKQLKAADPTNREFYISLGCALQNMLIAANHYQLYTTLTLFPSSQPYHIATLQLQPSRNRLDDQLFPYIQKRRTNRSPYQKSRSLPKQFIQAVEQTLTDQPAKCVFITHTNTIKELAQITYDGIFDALSSDQFTKELSDWVRHPWTQVGYGMTTNTMGIPDQFSFIAPALLTSPDMAALTAKDEYQAVDSAPAIAIIQAPDDSQLSWIHAGMAYQQVALLATKYNLASALLSAAIEMPIQRQKVAKLTHIKYPMLFCRVGYPTKKFPHSQRSPLNQVIIA